MAGVRWSCPLAPPPTHSKVSPREYPGCSRARLCHARIPACCGLGHSFLSRSVLYSSGTNNDDVVRTNARLKNTPRIHSGTYPACIDMKPQSRTDFKRSQCTSKAVHVWICCKYPNTLLCGHSPSRDKLRYTLSSSDAIFISPLPTRAKQCPEVKGPYTVFIVELGLRELSTEESSAEEPPAFPETTLFY